MHDNDGRTPVATFVIRWKVKNTSHALSRAFEIDFLLHCCDLSLTRRAIMHILRFYATAVAN